MSKKKKPTTRKTETPKPRPASRAPAPTWTHLLNKPSVRAGAILLVIILAMAVRFAFLGADPPLDVSWSHDLYTDPPQYTSYARNAIVFGNWNPLNDDRLVFFLKNITGVVAYLVFLVIGPSVSSGQVVAILINLLAIGALAWAVGRAFGFIAGWTSALALSISYLFVNYGRMPFLEVATNACLAVALLSLIASDRRWWLAAIAGVVAGVGTFFGKMTSLHAVPIFVLTAGLIAWQSSSDFCPDRRVDRMAVQFRVQSDALGTPHRIRRWLRSGAFGLVRFRLPAGFGRSAGVPEGAVAVSLRDTDRSDFGFRFLQPVGILRFGHGHFDMGDCAVGVGASWHGGFCRSVRDR
jgi:hypothetical protein